MNAKETQSNSERLLEAPGRELLPAEAVGIAEVTEPGTTEPEANSSSVWPDSLRNLPRSAGRTVFGVGLLAVGVRGPRISQEMVSAFHDNLFRTFSTTASAAGAAFAGGLYGYRAVKGRLSNLKPD